MSANPVPEGFHTITPYLITDGARQLIEFISEAFHGEVVFRKERPDGSIMHAEMKIGDSLLMLGEVSKFGPMPASLYLYVPDCDAVYQRAVKVGGVSVFEIMTMPSGERYGAVKDPCGNIWWIATHVEDVPPEVEEKRWREFKMP